MTLHSVKRLTQAQVAKRLDVDKPKIADDFRRHFNPKGWVEFDPDADDRETIFWVSAKGQSHVESFKK